jgi:hypothetical protein
MRTVAVLFARADSIYKTMPGCDVYDIDRDARTWPGGVSCRRASAVPRVGRSSPCSPSRGDDEKELAPWAIEQVRRQWRRARASGRLEALARARLPKPGEGRDRFGGWTLGIHQHWFGHRAEKRTLLYIVGIDPADIPDMPLRLDEPTHVIGDVGRAGKGNRPEVSKPEREHTPPPLASGSSSSRAAQPYSRRLPDAN